jgi:hypothetical protein
MKNKVMYLLVMILAIVIAFPNEIIFATFPEKSNFEEPNIVIITPCSRPKNLQEIKNSIDLKKIKRWYISYDCQDNKMEYTQRFPDEPKIKELKCTVKSISGNGPRNVALDEISKSEGPCIVYFLDDDNVLHQNFLEKDYKMNKIYTFDMLRNGADSAGNNISVGHIDTAQFLVDMSIIGNTRWVDKYEADGVFITDIIKRNKDKWEYIPETLAFYNSLYSSSP